MTLFKVILLSAGSVIALYMLWQLVALPFVGWIIDRLTFRKKPKDTPGKPFRMIDKEAEPEEWQKYLTEMSEKYNMPEFYFERPTLNKPSKN